MGLAGRKQKQIITADPRNTAWINDANNVGMRLLNSMGYVSPSADTGNEENKVGLMAYSGSKRLRAIPIAKSGMEGIGYRPSGGPAVSSVGALPTSIGSSSSGLASASSSVFSRLGSRAALQFVSAGASKEVINRAKTEGGEFAGLLQRLNAAAAEAALLDTNQADTTVDGETNSMQGETKEERRERKRLRKLDKEEYKAAKKARKMSGNRQSSLPPSTSQPDNHSISEIIQAVATAPASPATMPLNPRMASRARHLASKRMLHASADALAEILGIAPSAATSTVTSRSASPFALPSNPQPEEPSSAVVTTIDELKVKSKVKKS